MTTSGLTKRGARRRFAATGPNEITTTRRHAGLRQIGALLANPLGLILLGASAVSAALGETFSASLIALMVVLSVALNFVQTFRSERAAERLHVRGAAQVPARINRSEPAGACVRGTCLVTQVPTTANQSIGTP